MLEALLLAVLAGAGVYAVMQRRAGRVARVLREAAASEQRFRDLTELSADWFWETDASHRVTWISGGIPVATLFGGTPTYGKRFWEIAGVQVEPHALQALLDGIGERLPFFDLEIKRDDDRGARQVHIISGQCRKDRDGRFLGYRGVGRDVTEQRRAERALAAAKQRLELALSGGNLAEWDYDLAADALYLGAVGAAFIGRGPGPTLARGAELLALIYPDDRAALVRSFIASVKAEARVHVTDFRVRAEAGGWRWLRLTGRVSERDGAGTATRMSGTVADIDDQRRAEEALRKTEQRYRALVSLSGDGVLVSTRGIVEFANAAAARILRAAAPQQLIGMECEELLRPEGRSLECASTPLAEPGGAVTLTVFRDVTREERLRDAAEASGEYVWEADAGWRYSYLSDKVQAVLGYCAAELLGRRPQDFMPLGEERAVEEWLTKHAPEGRGFRELVHRSVTKGGGVIWQSVSAVPVRDGEGRFIGYRGTAADVTPRKQAEARIEYLATRDALTGLPNRTLLADRGRQALLQAARARSQLAALYIDLDRFKLVNESLGHQAGDALLRAVAERLETAMAADTLARLSGDDFVLLHAVRTAEEAAGIAQRVAAVLARPFVLDGRTLNVGASIGISVYPNDGRDLAELLKNAEAAMYHAKSIERGGFRFFSPALHARSSERLRLENELHAALARSELVLHWQPVVRGRRRVVGAEALVRWRHPGRGLLPPDDFVPLAEECGLIRQIGEWTLERALSQAGAWQRAAPGRAWVAVNVSAAELAQGASYIEKVRGALAANALPPAALELEVTERVLLTSLEENSDTLARLGDLGVRVAIDDFGTGYSSLAYLRRLPVHKLKIDRSFLRSIDTHVADEAIVRAIATLGRTLGIAVAAEGVENEAQLARLLALGCDEWQGHHFSAPLEAALLEKLLLRGDVMEEPRASA